MYMLKLLRKLFLFMIGGSRNDRIIRGRLRFVREQVNTFADKLAAMTDEQLRAYSDELKARVDDGASRNEVKAEAFSLVREASRRARDHRQFDVQLVAGLVLDDGWVAEEATGEGKTIACYPAIYMAYLEGMKTHVVTVNDYLVQRDAEFARPIFELLGVSVGHIASEMPTSGDEAAPRRQAYACNVTYGTNSEFGFDYLRDNMKTSESDQMHGPLDFAIIDEVDSILIDEARTPLIISGPAYGQTERFSKADSVAREVISRNHSWDQVNRRVETIKRDIKALNGEKAKAKGDKLKQVEAKIRQAEQRLDEAEGELDNETKHYEVELDKKSAHLTHEGVGVAQEIAGVGSFYVGSNMEWPHLMDNALRAHLVYEKDKDYVVQQGLVIIVDEFTGRLMEGREWSDGLHQAVDAKERVTIKEENQTLATITIRPRSSLTSHSRGSSWFLVTPRSASNVSSAFVTRSWKWRNDSPPGRPSHHSSCVRCLVDRKMSMTASSVTPSQSGIWISSRSWTVSIDSPVFPAIGVAVSWDRIAGETINSAVATFSSDAIRDAARSACWLPNSVRRVRLGEAFDCPLWLTVPYKDDVHR